MTQLNLYLQPELYKMASLKAKRRKISLSRLVAEMLEEKLLNAWPEDYFDLFGILVNSDIERPSEGNTAQDIKRISI